MAGQIGRHGLGHTVRATSGAVGHLTPCSVAFGHHRGTQQNSPGLQELVEDLAGLKAPPACGDVLTGADRKPKLHHLPEERIEAMSVVGEHILTEKLSMLEGDYCVTIYCKSCIQ